MAHIIADRVRDTSTTTGTGDITVSGTPPVGFVDFDSILATSDTFYYCIDNELGEWEVGLGTYAGSDVIERTTVLASSNSNLAVDFSAGTKQVFITIPAVIVDFLTGLTGNIQTQLDGKSDTSHTHALTDLTDVNITTPLDGEVLTYVDASSTWQAIAPAGGVDTANSPSANEFARFTDADTIEGRTASEVRADLDLEIGTDVQAYGATLTSLEGLSLVAGDLLYATAADTLTRLAKGTASQELRMNSGATAPEWFTPSAGGSGPVFAEMAVIHPNFVMNTGGWNSFTNGSGAALSVNATEGYLRMQSSSAFTADTLAAYQKYDYSMIDTTFNPFDKDMRFTAVFKSKQATNSPSESFFGTVDQEMNVAGDIPFTKTAKHIGIYRTTGSGASTFTASNANGTTQTSTTFTGPTNDKYASWRIDFTAGSDIKFYLNGTLVATHTTNLPTGAQTVSGTSLCIAIGNTGTQVGAAPELMVVSAKMEIEA